MANICTIKIIIATDEESMLKVMRRFQDDFESTACVTGFDDAISALVTVEEIYEALRPYLEDHYMLAFRDDYEIERITDESGEERCFVQPTYRGMSDQAFSELKAKDEYLVFQLGYCTAHGPNSDDTDYFFSRLPVGRYGIAVFWDDPYDPDEVLGSAFFTEGENSERVWRPLDNEDLLSNSDLEIDGQSYFDDALNRFEETNSLEDLAYLCALAGWIEDEAGGYLDIDDDGIDCEDDEDDEPEED